MLTTLACAFMTNQQGATTNSIKGAVIVSQVKGPAARTVRNTAGVPSMTRSFRGMDEKPRNSIFIFSGSVSTHSYRPTLSSPKNCTLFHVNGLCR